jgi:dihydrodipicolinate synthase/N-acetylneuraminate lyase
MSKLIECQFQGVYVVVPTPLKDDEGLDREGLRHLINYYIESGCHGILVLGSGGEFPYFSYQERLQIVNDAVAAVEGRVPLMVGVGFNSQVETLSFIRQVDTLAVDAFLVITPTFYPAGYEDIFRFFSDVCNASSKPILYYNYPQMTGVFLSSEQIVKLMSIDGMVGMKDSILGLSEIRKHIDQLADKFGENNKAVFSGNSFALESNVCRGGAGVIAVLPSVIPKLVVEGYNAAVAQDVVRLDKLQSQILNLMPLMNNFASKASIQKRVVNLLGRLPITLKARNASRAAVIKETLRQLGHPITSRVRSPQPQITPSERQAIAEIIETNIESFARKPRLY